MTVIPEFEHNNKIRTDWNCAKSKGSGGKKLEKLCGIQNFKDHCCARCSSLLPKVVESTTKSPTQIANPTTKSPTQTANVNKSGFTPNDAKGAKDASSPLLIIGGGVFILILIGSSFIYFNRRVMCEKFRRQNHQVPEDQLPLSELT